MNGFWQYSESNNFMGKTKKLFSKFPGVFLNSEEEEMELEVEIYTLTDKKW